MTVFSRNRASWVFLAALCCVLTSVGALGQAPDQIRIAARDTGGRGLLCESGGKRILMLSGSPEEMGAAHGRLLAGDVRAVAQGVMYVVGAGYSASKGDWFFDRMAEIEERTRPHTPERFLRECDAMSAAAGVTLRDGRTVNFFPELFHCSGAAVRGTASAGGKVVHARVLDYMRDIRLQKHAVIQLWMPSEHYAWLSLGYGGFIGTVTCMNEKGLAIGEMGGRGEGNWDGMPMNFLLRDAMERAATVREAIAILRETPRTCEYYYVLSDRSRDIAGVAATHDTFEVLEAGQQHDLLPPVPADTVFLSAGSRAKHLSERLHEHHGRIDVPTMIDLIKRPVAMNSNLHDAIFQPESLDMWCADAGIHTVACDEPYLRVNLDDLMRYYRNAMGNTVGH
ncbi:MAG: peptidase C45 [Lentisphaeria bacterium]|nr:peptidase C45 [Lentisphaeria bacterium]